MSLVAWLFAMYVGLCLPYLAWRSSLRVERGAAFPPRTRLYASTAIFEAILLAFAWVTARQQSIQLFPAPDIRPFDAMVGVVWVALKYLRFRLVARQPDALRRRRVLRRLAPRSPREVAGYASMVTLVAVAEEAAYRGVLFQLGLFATGSFWIAGVASAVVFGLAHLVQGRRHAVVAGVLGFGNQVVVLLTGSLWVAIAAHFAYDVLVGITAGRMGRDADADAAAPRLAQHPAAP